MNRYARTSEQIDAQVFYIARPFSNFEFVEKQFENLALSPIRRLMSQVRRHEGKTLVLEKIKESKDLQEENEDILARRSDFKASISWRLSFFKKRLAKLEEVQDTSSDDFIGYAVIKRDDFITREPVIRIYESVIKESKHPNNYIRGSQVWNCKVYENIFSIKGYLYAQQNGITNTCAHVATRTVAARFHPEGDITYREMNNLVGIDLAKENIRGLNPKEIKHILENSGAKCFIGSYDTPPPHPVPFQKYIYGSIESGCPAIIGFKVQDLQHQGNQPAHCIPVIGHTFNEDIWVPHADVSYFSVGETLKYIPSDSWTSMFIAHDDNCGSHFCIPKEYIKKDEVICVIGTVPKDVLISPIRAEVIGSDYLSTILPQMPATSIAWGKRLSYFFNENRLVFRPVLIKWDQYIEHLDKLHDWDGHFIDKEIIGIFKNMKIGGYLWMVELSVPDLFAANRRKIAEVILNAEINPTNKQDLSAFLLIRIPGYFGFLERVDPSNPRYRFFHFGVDGHVELIYTEDCAMS